MAQKTVRWTFRGLRAAATMKQAAEESARLAADIRAQPKKYLKMNLF